MALKVKFLPAQTQRWQYWQDGRWQPLATLPDQPTTGLFQLTMFETEGISPSEIKDSSLSDPSLLDSAAGAWAAVEISSDRVVLATDIIRSFPLYWAWQDDILWVSDNYQSLADQIATTVDDLSLEALYFAGYTLGERTFSQEISCLSAGQQLVLCHPDQLPVRVEYANLRFIPEDQAVSDPHIFQLRMQQVLDYVLTELMKRASICPPTPNGGRPKFLLPLSGGLDSRLLATWFAEHEVPNVLCFTYGLAGCAEMSVSKQVADSLDLPWVGVELDSDQVRQAWEQPEMAQLLNYGAAGTALPHLQDWYALHYLLAQGTIQPGDIVLPGHTPVGNFPHYQLAEEPNRSLGELCALLWKEHYQLHPDLPSSALKQAFKSQVHQILQQTGPCRSERSLQVFMEYFNLTTRQIKYINNSMRIYEALGLRWSLPMLHPDFMQTWFTGSFDLTVSRNFYRNWINEYYAKVTGQDLAYTNTKLGRLPTPVKQSLKTIAEFTGVSQRIQHHLSVRAQLPHSLGLHLYLSGLSDDDIRGRLKAHIPLLGLWVEQLLDGSWHPGLDPLSTANSIHATHLPR